MVSWDDMDRLLLEIRACERCAGRLPFAPKPVVQADVSSRIVIVGQAPGSKVQASGVPWDDASGKQLREWLGVRLEEFYDPELFAMVPMGFCYPGRGKSGDLPPIRECAPFWHKRLIDKMPQVRRLLFLHEKFHRPRQFLNSNFAIKKPSLNWGYPLY